MTMRMNHTSRKVSRETPAITKLRQDLERQGKIFFYKIPDSPNKFQHRKPFDVMGCIESRGFAIEFKYHHSIKRAWPIASVVPHQKKALLDFSFTGGASFVGVFVQDELYMLDIIEFNSIAGKSVRFDELNEWAYIRKISGRYDLDAFHSVISDG